MEAFSLTRQVDAVHVSRCAHLVGIAGNGMRALADVLVSWGWTLSGSDANAVEVSRLACAGVQGYAGHAAENVAHDTELIVYSDAVPPDNPELRRAAELGIPALSYFQMLGRLSAGRPTIAVAGTHGKSTTTAMLAHVLVRAGQDPTVLCGAAPIGATSGGRAGRLRAPLPLAEGPEMRMTDGIAQCKLPHPIPSLLPRPSSLPNPQSTLSNPFFLIEACEYRSNFLHLRPTQAAILNVELDHVDCFDSLAAVEGAFRRFAALLPEAGFLLARHDCESTRRAIQDAKCRVETFGLASGADWSATGLEADRGRFRFTLLRRGCPLCPVRLSVPGRHNVLNALAAAALAYENGVSAEEIAAGLADFPGLRRRLETLGAWRGATVIDDYAHHPTEVAAALAAVRLMHPHARVWCVFQPHQASRTARLLDELAKSLQNADNVMVAEVFRAREGVPRPGEATAADLARRAAELGAAVVPVHATAEIVEVLRTQLAPGDVWVTLGAGNMEGFRDLGI